MSQDGSCHAVYILAAGCKVNLKLLCNIVGIMHAVLTGKLTLILVGQTIQCQQQAGTTIIIQNQAHAIYG